MLGQNKSTHKIIKQRKAFIGRLENTKLYNTLYTAISITMPQYFFSKNSQFWYKI